MPETVKELGVVLESMISEEQVSSNSKLLFVDDGSKDKTWELIKKFENQFEYVTGIRFSRNYGHQNALLAGLTTAVDYSDMTITIDADLQDDVNAIPEMVKKYHEGIDVVYGVRNNRNKRGPSADDIAIDFLNNRINKQPDSNQYDQQTQIHNQFNRHGRK